MSRTRNRDVDTELDITAFLNLMVVLIPFLLLNAVFAQVSVLQINLPQAEEAAPPEDNKDKPPFVLEILVYENRYEVVDRQTGPLKIIKNKDDKHDFATLHSYLKKLKDKASDITSATVLCEDDTPYELLIATMDTVRVTSEVKNAGVKVKKELFPEISIGSAPADTAKGKGGKA